MKTTFIQLKTTFIVARERNINWWKDVESVTITVTEQWYGFHNA